MIAALPLSGEGEVPIVLAVFRAGSLTVLQTLHVLVSLLEPGVTAAAVVYDQIKDDLDATLVALGHQRVKIVHGAVLRINGIVVIDIVLMIAVAGVDGHQPNAVYAQFLQIIQLGNDALQIADAIAIGIAEGVNKNFVPSAIIIIRAAAQLSILLQPCFQLIHTAFGIRRAGGRTAHQHKYN